MRSIMLERSGKVKPFFRIPVDFFRQPPYPHIPSEPLPEPGRAVTIAIGFNCNDGIVLATDSRYTYGPLKTDGPKLFISADLPNIAVVTGGAGAVSFMRRAAEKLQEAFKTLEPASPDDVRCAAERVLAQFYQQYIYPMPDYRQKESAFDLILGVWTPGGFGLFQTEQALLTPAVDNYCDIGCGQYVSKYALKLAIPADAFLEVEKAKLIAALCIKAAMDNVDYCGGPTKIMTIRNTPPYRVQRIYPTEIADAEAYTDDLTSTIRDLLQFLEIGEDMEFDDAMLETVVSGLKSSIAGLRAKREKRKRVEERRRLRQLGKQNPQASTAST